MNAVQFVIDKTGKKRSVIIPFAEWKRMNNNHRMLQNKLAILSGIKEGILEVKRARKRGAELQSLTDFLDESRS